jgi:phosphoribosyl 1,2-cyclic phosphate phosphodiesterase
LRSLFIKRRQRLDVYLDDATAAMMRSRFAYCFQSPPGSSYPPIATEHRLTAGNPVLVTGSGGSISVLPFLQDHGDIPSLGFRFGGLAYSCDLSGIPESSLDALDDLEVWILDALRYTPHPSHFSVDDALRWIEHIKPRRAVLTNLHADLDYDVLSGKLPSYVTPAFDGMTLTLADAQ